LLIPKVEQRIGRYLNLLEKNACRKIADLEFETYEKEGSRFRFRAVYNAPLSDNPIFLSVTPNEDSLAFIDGRPAGAFDMYHNEIRIDADGKEHTLQVEAYSEGCLLERRRAIHSLFYDIRALYETAKIADPNSLRKAKILKGLSLALNGISLNTDGEEFEKQAAAAAQTLAPLLALKNGPSAPAVHLVGRASIDHASNIAETGRKAARTFANMLRFINEYPEFIFLQSQPCQLEIVKNEYPEIFAAVKEAFKNGNWEPNGGMWVEADCDIPSGESLVRQFLVGKKVNKELLGHEADTLWLPDVSGYAASLPQIMAGCRIKYFATGKINWNDTTRFPYETFIWRGIDGTGVKTHFLSTIGPGAGYNYNGRAVPEELAAVWNAVQRKEVQSACVKPIGEGDGGTLRADLEMASRLGDLEGTPRAAWKTAGAALAEIFDSGEFPEWRGDLYMEPHRGIYATQARAKRDNRLLEFSLRRAEFFCSLAALDGKGEYPHEILLDLWKHMLIYQFHGIITGSSIWRRAYKETEEDSGKMLTKLAQISDSGKRRLVKAMYTSNNMAVFAFNDLSWERETAVTISEDLADKAAALQSADGAVYPVQRFIDHDGNMQAVFFPKTPSMGWVRLAVLNENNEEKSPFTWKNNILESPFYTITFDTEGRITSLTDQRQGREMVAPGGVFNALITAEDARDDIDADWIKRIRQETRLVSTEITAYGPVCFRLRRTYEIGEASRLVQDMVCYAGDPRIDFDTKVSWHEKWRLLNVEFDTAIEAIHVRCEVQYGHVLRNTHRGLMQDRPSFEICAHKWISLEEEGAGIALLNNCKYGHNVEGGRMRLSLLRSPIAPDPEADLGEHYFTYSILPFAGHFGDSGVIRSAYELNSPAEALLIPVSQIADDFDTESFCSVDGNQVIIESVKAPEDGTPGELILRLYECLGGKSRTTLHFHRALRAAAQTDMLEENPQILPVQGCDIDLEFRPFEIKTIRVEFIT
jgi:alpha-mannosidase